MSCWRLIVPDIGSDVDVLCGGSQSVLAVTTVYRVLFPLSFSYTNGVSVGLYSIDIEVMKIPN